MSFGHRPTNSRLDKLMMLWGVLVVLPFLVHGQKDDGLVDTFSAIDMNDVKNQPIKFGLLFFDDRPDRHKKMSKSLGKSLNTGVWPTLWEVSSSGPAPWEADDERMDMWIGSIYRNLYEKHDTMRNATYYFGNHSIEIIAKFLGVPEAYRLTTQQKKYREEKAAEKEGREPDLLSFYCNHIGLDHARIDDLGKFYAATVDHLKGLGVPLPYVELFDEVADPGELSVYFNSTQVTYLIKKARDELDARNLLADEVKILGPGVDRPGQIRPYLKALANDKEAYDKLYAITTHFIDNGSLPLENIAKQATRFHKDIKDIIPLDWEEKPVVVSGLRYAGPEDVEYGKMRYYGDIQKCYDDTHGRTGHKTLIDSISQAPQFAVRTLASITTLLSHGFPWVVYNKAADTWWNRGCDGLIDKNDKPKQLLAALETVISYFTNETYPVQKQWKNYDECFISAYKSVQTYTRYIITVTNYSPSVCERSFSLKGIDLWDIKRARITTYNNGTVSLDAERPYRALVSTKTLSYDTYDEDDGTSIGPEIEFDLAVGPYASATAVIDSKTSKKKRKQKPKKKPSKEEEEDLDEEEEEIEFDEDEELNENEKPEVTPNGGSGSLNANTTEVDNDVESKPDHNEL